jgi:tetratricopeptide (TPR) repeat protein
LDAVGLREGEPVPFTFLGPDPGGEAAAEELSGEGGIGKTALAVAAAHAAQKRGWFSGTLFVNLRGQDTDPATADQALESLLCALDVPSARIPPLLTDQRTLYLSRLAHSAEERGGPLLVIADNASMVAQVEPLLPEAGGHRLPVSSRSEMHGLPARQLSLDVLSTADSVALMASVLAATDREDDQVEADPVSAREIAAACGGLPLTLLISMAMVRAEPDRPLSHLAADLTGRQEHSSAATSWSRWRRPAAKSQGPSDPRGGDQAITGLLDRAVDALPSEQQNLFTLLAVAPGRDITSAAASVLNDTTPQHTSHLLRELASARLVNYSPSTGRWSMHDLVHAYARTRTNVGHGGQHHDALIRLLDHYTHTAKTATTRLKALPGDQKPTEFTDREEALAWLDAERAVLVDSVHTAERIGHTRIAIDLPLALSTYLLWRRAFTDLISVNTVARETAHLAGEPLHEGGAWNSLGIALRELRRFEEAITALQRARDLFAGLGAKSSEATAQNNLGNAFHSVGRFENAAKAHQHDLAYHQKVNDRRREAGASNNLGTALNSLRRFEEAITVLQRARTLCTEIGDRHTEGKVLGNLGVALLNVGRLEEAVTIHQGELACSQEIGDRHDEAGAWRNLGLTLRKLNRVEEAISHLQNARTLYAEVGDRHSEALTWHNLGNYLHKLERDEEAVTALQNARGLYAQVGDRGGEADAWYSLGAVLHKTGRFEDAIAAYQHVIAYRQETGDTEGEAKAWYMIGFVLPELGQLDEAKEAMEKMLTLSTETGNDRRQGSARRMLDWLRKQTGDTTEGA